MHQTIKKALPYLLLIILITWAAWQATEFHKLHNDDQSLTESVDALRGEQDALQSKADQRHKEVLEAISKLKAEEFKPDPDVPLSAALQRHTYNLCREYDVPYEVVLAVMERETGFRDLTEMDSNGFPSTGLMQVNAINWPDMEAQGIDVHTTEGAIEAGVIILAGYWHRYPPEQALASYNAGETGMRAGGGRRYAKKVLEVVGHENPSGL